MRKSMELALPDSCLNKAGKDEMIFVLRGKDIAAPATVRFWIEERIRLGKNCTNDPQMLEAAGWIDTVEKEHGKQPQRDMLRFTYFKASGKYYSSGEMEITRGVVASLFERCIYPKEFGARARELKMMPGIAGGIWRGPFTVEHRYPEFVAGLGEE